MAKSPAFQMYAKDCLTDMNFMLMSMEQRGVYITLLLLMWVEGGSLPSDPEILNRLCGYPKNWDEVWLRVSPSFIEKDGFISNKRMSEEIKKQRAWRRKSSEGGKKSAESRRESGTKGGSTNEQPKGNSSSSSSSSIASSNNKYNTFDQNEFDRFWASYPRKIGKGKCLAWFKQRKPQNVDKMLTTIDLFKTSEQWQDPTLIPHPYTWLNRGGWDDELTKEKTTADFVAEAEAKLGIISS